MVYMADGTHVHMGLVTYIGLLASTARPRHKTAMPGPSAAAKDPAIVVLGRRRDLPGQMPGVTAQV